jgi:hypothetical protein
MRRLRRPVFALAAFAGAVFCCAPTAGAPRGGALPCPYSVNLSYQLQWVPVPVSPRPQPQSTIPMRMPTPTPGHTIPAHQPVGTTAVPPPAHPATTHQQTTVVHTTTRQETITQHTYPTRQETVHHTLTAQVRQTENRTTETVQHLHLDAGHGESRIHAAESTHVGHGGPGHGFGEAIHVTARTATTTHAHVSTELHRYEQQHVQTNLHVEVHEHTTVTHGEHKVTDRTVSERTNTQVHTQTHTTPAHPAPEPVAKHDPKKAPPETPKVTPRESDPGKPPPDSPDKVRYVPVLKVTAQVNFQCGSCHNASQPSPARITANPPSCNRSPTPLPVDLLVTGRGVPARPLTPFVDRPFQPLVPAVVRSQPTPTPPDFVALAPRRPPDLVTSRPSASRITSATFWGDDTPSAVPAPTGTQEQLPFFTLTSDGSQPSRQDAPQTDALDAIFQAPSLPPVIGPPPGPEDRPAPPPPSAAEVVFDPPALPPVPPPAVPDAWARVSR